MDNDLPARLGIGAEGGRVLLQDAYESASALLDKIRPSHSTEIVIVSCTEFPSAWVFGYNTRRFMEGEIIASLVGNGPVVVPKSGSAPYLGGSGTPIADQLKAPTPPAGVRARRWLSRFIGISSAP